MLITTRDYAIKHGLSYSSLNARVISAGLIVQGYEATGGRTARLFLETDMDRVFTDFSPAKASQKDVPRIYLSKRTMLEISDRTMLTIRLTTQGFRGDHDLTKHSGYRDKTELERVKKRLNQFGNGHYDSERGTRSQ